MTAVAHLAGLRQVTARGTGEHTHVRVWQCSASAKPGGPCPAPKATP